MTLWREKRNSWLWQCHQIKSPLFPPLDPEMPCHCIWPQLQKWEERTKQTLASVFPAGIKQRLTRRYRTTFSTQNSNTSSTAIFPDPWKHNQILPFESTAAGSTTFTNSSTEQVPSVLTHSTSTTATWHFHDSNSRKHYRMMAYAHIAKVITCIS